MPRPVVFLSDFGLDDVFVGVCHGVLARGSPLSRVIDLTHSVRPMDVRHGAFLLARAAAYMPDDAVYLAVVDPGVGTARRPLALETASGAAMVGPDNGLLSLAWIALGGVARAVEVASPAAIMRPRSSTFHGRDVFAPAAAHLAAGRPLDALGPPLGTSETLVTLDARQPETGEGWLRCEVIGVDRFGNVELGAAPSDLDAAGVLQALEMIVGDHVVAMVRAATFDDVEPGAIGLIVDSSGSLAVVVNRGNAAGLIGLAAGAIVTLRVPVAQVG